MKKKESFRAVPVKASLSHELCWTTQCDMRPQSMYCAVGTHPLRNVDWGMHGCKNGKQIALISRDMVYCQAPSLDGTPYRYIYCCYCCVYICNLLVEMLVPETGRAKGNPQRSTTVLKRPTSSGTQPAARHYCHIETAHIEST